MGNNIANSPIPELFYPESAPGRRGTRHARKCVVCRHPDREAIEEAFLHWHSPTEIATDYELTSAPSIATPTPLASSPAASAM